MIAELEAALKELSKNHVDENIDNPTEMDYLYSQNTMLKAADICLEWIKKEG